MVKITVLHNELEQFVNSHSGFSVLIEADGKRILFDTSHSDEFIINAKKSGINLDNIDYLVLSHGHWDHTNGLTSLNGSSFTIIAHPDCFERKYRDVRYIGAPLSIEEARKSFRIELYKDPKEITKNVIFLGEIPRTNNFEGKNPVGKKQNGEDDLVLDDSALAIKSGKGLIIITGCGHSGICNTIEYAKKVTKEHRISAVIGGFHLFDKKQTEKTICYFKELGDVKIYPLHCLDTHAFSEFEKIGAKRLRTLEQIEL